MCDNRNYVAIETTSCKPEAILFLAHDWQVELAAEFAAELKRRRGLAGVALVHGTKDKLCALRSNAFAEVADVVGDFDLSSADARAAENLIALKDFEAAHGGASVWQGVMQDARRRFDSRYSLKRYSYNQLLDYLGHALRTLESVFSRWSVLATVGQLTNPVYRMAFHMGRPCLIPVTARFFHRFYFDDDIYLRWEDCVETYRRYMRDGIPAELGAEADAMAHKISVAKLRPTYFDAAVTQAGNNSLLRRLRSALSLHHAEDIWFDGVVDGKKNPEGVHWSYWLPPRNVARAAQWALRKRWYRRHALHTIPGGAPFALFLPNSEPEYTLDVQGWPFADQASLIRAIAESLPIGMLLLVKDHLLMVGARRLSFYRKILHLPNVRLVAETVSSQELARASRLVLTVTGTVALEAVASRVPVIMFGKVFLNDLAGVSVVHDLYELPKTISTVLDGTGVDYDRSASAMLAAIFNSSYPGRIDAERNVASCNRQALGDALEAELCRRGILPARIPEYDTQRDSGATISLSGAAGAGSARRTTPRY